MASGAEFVLCASTCVNKVVHCPTCCGRVPSRLSHVLTVTPRSVCSPVLQSKPTCIDCSCLGNGYATIKRAAVALTTVLSHWGQHLQEFRCSRYPKVEHTRMHQHTRCTHTLAISLSSAPVIATCHASVVATLPEPSCSGTTRLVTHQPAACSLSRLFATSRPVCVSTPLGCARLTKPQLQALLQQYTQLQRLDISGCTDTQGPPVPAQLRLTSLALDDCTRLGPQWAARCIMASHATLQHLSAANFSDMAAPIVSAARQVTGLRSLRLSRTVNLASIDDVLRYCTQLQHLDIAGCSCPGRLCISISTGGCSCETVCPCNLV